MEAREARGIHGMYGNFGRDGRATVIFVHVFSFDDLYLVGKIICTVNRGRNCG